MSDLSSRIEQHLQPLIGLPLSIVRRAADMRIFHFGSVSFEQERSFGQFALHIQCPWRITQPSGIVTGRSDLWEPLPTDTDYDGDDWKYDVDGNLQDHRLAELFRCPDSSVSIIAHPATYLVQSLSADRFGGLSMQFGERYTLQLFPSGSSGEDWRFFSPGGNNHLVIAGGVIEKN